MGGRHETPGPQGAAVFSPPQVAFEVLSFVSVISNCWLLLLSPRLRELLEGGGMSSTNVVLLAVLVEVRTGDRPRPPARSSADALSLPL